MTGLSRARVRVAAAALIIGTGALARPLGAQWTQVHEQFYLPAEHNWVFRQNYSNADRLFNAFDYGHAILYETLYAKPDAPVAELERRQYDFLTQRLLRQPPRLPLEEGAIEIAYARLAPEAKAMFDWAHLLHRQLYDVLADERLSQAEKDAEVATLLAYYKTRPDLAFSSEPKSMELMDGQFYSLAFREKYPKFNGLIWAYHWLQVGLYEPLLVNSDRESRARGVSATVARFWQMLENAPETMPYLMPMTVAVAPAFAERYPEAAIIFDNLHMMHDVVSDILASPEVPRDVKRDAILQAATRFRDDTTSVIAFDDWRMMDETMGANNMGGPAVGFTAELPRPTVARGQSMAGMDHAGMDMGGGAAAQGGAMAGMDHSQMSMGGASGPVTPAEPMAGMDHSGMAGMTGATQGSPTMEQMMAMHQRMMADPVIRERIATDPMLQAMMQGMGDMSGMTGGMGVGASTATVSAEQEAEDFIVRLLSDPQVEARVHSDPDLHRLWIDPEVQRRLAELRRERAAAGASPAPAAPGAPVPATPAAPATPQPQHQH